MSQKNLCSFAGLVVAFVTVSCSDVAVPDSRDFSSAVEETVSDAAELRAQTRSLTEPSARHAARLRALADAAQRASDGPDARARYYSLRDELMRDPEVQADFQAVVKALGQSYPATEVR